MLHLHYVQIKVGENYIHTKKVEVNEELTSILYDSTSFPFDFWLSLRICNIQLAVELERRPLGLSESVKSPSVVLTSP